MHRNTLAVTWRVFAVVLCTLGAPARATTIMPLGDSITRGFGSVDSGGYRKFLYSYLRNSGWDVDFVGSLSNGAFPEPQHEGHDGSYIRQLHFNWALSAQQTYDPQITLLMIGTNDCWTGTGLNSPELAPSNLTNLISGIFSVNPDTQLYVASIPRIWNGQLGQEYATVPIYNAAIPGIVSSFANQGRAIHFVDVYPWVSVPQLIDGVHPDDSGYAAIASAFYFSMTGSGPFSKGDRMVRFGGVLATVPEPGGAFLTFGAVFWLLTRRK